MEPAGNTSLVDVSIITRLSQSSHRGVSRHHPKSVAGAVPMWGVGVAVPAAGGKRGLTRAPPALLVTSPGLAWWEQCAGLQASPAKQHWITACLLDVSLPT